MRKINIYLIFVILLSGLAFAMPAYDFKDDSVFIDDENVFLSVAPSLFKIDRPADYVYINFTSKVFSGNVNLLFGYEHSSIRPTSLEILSGETWVNIPVPSTNYFYYKYDNKSDWRYAENLYVTAGTEYKARLKLETGNITGKYDVALYPSSYGTTISGIANAINNNHFYLLDPWIGTSYFDPTEYNQIAASTIVFKKQYTEINRVVNQITWKTFCSGTSITNGAIFEFEYTDGSKLNYSVSGLSCTMGYSPLRTLNTDANTKIVKNIRFFMTKSAANTQVTNLNRTFTILDQEEFFSEPYLLNISEPSNASSIFEFENTEFKITNFLDYDTIYDYWFNAYGGEVTFNQSCWVVISNESFDISSYNDFFYESDINSWIDSQEKIGYYAHNDYLDFNQSVNITSNKTFEFGETYFWTGYCAGDVYYDGVYDNFTIFNMFPEGYYFTVIGSNITINLPINNTFSKTGKLDVNFTYDGNPTETKATINLTLLNGSVKNSSSITVGDSNIISYTFPQDGRYQYYLTSNRSGLSTTRTFTKDSTGPTVKIDNTYNGTVVNNLNFYGNFSDSLSNAANMTLFINGTPVKRLNNVVNNTDYLFESNTTFNGNIEVWLKATDKAGNSANSSKVFLEVVSIDLNYLILDEITLEPFNLSTNNVTLYQFCDSGAFFQYDVNNYSDSIKICSKDREELSFLVSSDGQAYSRNIIIDLTGLSPTDIELDQSVYLININTTPVIIQSTFVVGDFNSELIKDFDYVKIRKDLNETLLNQQISTGVLDLQNRAGFFLIENNIYKVYVSVGGVETFVGRYTPLVAEEVTLNLIALNLTMDGGYRNLDIYQDTMNVSGNKTAYARLIDSSGAKEYILNWTIYKTLPYTGDILYTAGAYNNTNVYWTFDIQQYTNDTIYGVLSLNGHPLYEYNQSKLLNKNTNITIPILGFLGQDTLNWILVWLLVIISGLTTVRSMYYASYFVIGIGLLFSIFNWLPVAMGIFGVYLLFNILNQWRGAV